MTLLGAGVAGLFVRGASQHGQPPLRVLVRGGTVLSIVALFWFGTAGYRIRGGLELDDDQVRLVDRRGRVQWRLPVAELGVEVAGGMVTLRSVKGVRRISTRLFESSADVDRFTQALLVRALGEAAQEMLHGVFSELLAEAEARESVASHDAALDPERDAELEARLDRELEKLD